VIGTDCIGSCKSNYHTIMTMALNGYLTWNVLCIWSICEICEQNLSM